MAWECPLRRKIRMAAIALSDDYSPEQLELHVEDIKIVYVNALSNYVRDLSGEEPPWPMGINPSAPIIFSYQPGGALIRDELCVCRIISQNRYNVSKKYGREASREVGAVTERNQRGTEASLTPSPLESA